MRVFIVLLFCTLSLFAHKLNLFIEEKEKFIYLYSYYASGAPCKNCKIWFLDKNEKMIKSVKTDEKGEYILKDKINIKFVKVEALGGHAVLKELENFKEIDKKEENIYLTSLMAVFVLGLLFMGLKRIKR